MRGKLAKRLRRLESLVRARDQNETVTSYSPHAYDGVSSLSEQTAPSPSPTLPAPALSTLERTWVRKWFKEGTKPTLKELLFVHDESMAREAVEIYEETVELMQPHDARLQQLGTLLDDAHNIAWLSTLFPQLEYFGYYKVETPSTWQNRCHCAGGKHTTYSAMPSTSTARRWWQYFSVQLGIPPLGLYYCRTKNGWYASYRHDGTGRWMDVDSTLRVGTTGLVLASKNEWSSQGNTDPVRNGPKAHDFQGCCAFCLQNNVLPCTWPGCRHVACQNHTRELDDTVRYCFAHWDRGDV